MRLLIVLVMLMTAAVAAPIPKSLKAKKQFDITGMWKLVEFNSNGTRSPHENMIQFWDFTDESFEYYKDANTRQGQKPTMLTTPDPEQPQFKKMGGSPCCFERAGNRMVWVYSADSSFKLENCEPGPQRNVYTFELVK